MGGVRDCKLLMQEKKEEVEADGAKTDYKETDNDKK